MAATLYDPYGNVIYSFNTPSGGGPGGGAVDPSRDAIFLGNLLLKGSVGFGPGAFLQESATDSITANAGATQATATILNAELNRVATVAAVGNSVVLPASQAGLTIFVVNHGANAMQVFGAGTDTIDDIATATGVSQMANSVVLYFCATAGKWYSEGLATGFATTLGLQTLSYQDSITAHAGGGQASGFPITKMISRVSVVATTGDSVTLPVSAPGVSLAVYNGASNSMNVFPNAGGTGTEQINAVGANNAFAIAGTTYNIFTCFTAGQWFTK